MVDNYTTASGTGGNTYASDDIGTVHWPRVKVSWGVDGAAVDASATNPLPVVQTGALPGGTNNIGDVDVLTLPAISLANGNLVHVDYDSGAGTQNIPMVGLSLPAAGGAVAGGTAANPFRTDPTGTTPQPVSGTVTANLAAGTNNIGDVDVLTLPAVTNAGTFAVQESGGALTALQLIDNSQVADDAAFTVATTGVNVVGFLADETAPDSVDEGDAGAARMTLDRRQIVVPQPHATGGCTIFRSLDLDETEEEVKATGGCVYGMWVTNTATATRWIKFYNATALNVTVGTTAPVLTIGIPGNTTDDIAGNFGPGGVGVQFDTAITVAATTGVADADVGAPAANDVIVNIFYK